MVLCRVVMGTFSCFVVLPSRHSPLWISHREISAYSVFNRGIERILGTFTAEQIDREIRRVPLDAH